MGVWRKNLTAIKTIQSHIYLWLSWRDCMFTKQVSSKMYSMYTDPYYTCSHFNPKSDKHQVSPDSINT